MVQKNIFLQKYFAISNICCTFAAENIPRVGIMDWGVPGWKGLSVRAILFLCIRDDFNAHLLHIFCINIIFYYIICHIRLIRI